MSSARSLLSTTLLITLGKGSAQALTFLLLPVITTRLNTAEYGVYDIVLTLAVFLAPSLAWQIELGIFRFLIDARGNARRTQAIYAILRNVLVCSIAIAVGGSVVGGFFLKNLLFVQILAIICLTICSGLIMQTLRGIGRNSSYAVASIVYSVVNFISTLLALVVFDAGLDGVLWSLIISNISVILFSIVFLPGLLSFKTKFDRLLFREILTYSLPLVPNNLGMWAISASNRLIITVLLGISAAGIYAAGSKISQLITVFFSFFYLAWNESVSVNYSKPGSAVFLNRAFNAGLWLVVSVGLLLISTGPIYFKILVAENFHPALNLLPLLILGAVANAISLLYGAVYVARMDTRGVALTTLFGAILNVALTFTFLPVLGLQGAALATFISFAAVSVVRHIQVKRSVKFVWQKSRQFVSVLIIPVTLLPYLSHNSTIQFICAAIVALACAYLNGPLIAKIRVVIADRLHFPKE